MSTFLNNAGVTGNSGNYEISNSLRFDASSTTSIHKNYNGITADSDTTATISFWVKRSGLGTQQELFKSERETQDVSVDCLFHSDDTLWFIGYNAGFIWQLKTTAVYRDCSYWMHIHITMDTTETTASDRLSMSIDGVEVTDFSTETYPVLDSTISWNQDVIHRVGTLSLSSRWYDGYFAEFVSLDGTAEPVTSFGETHPDNDSVWRPKSLAGLDLSGTSSIYLPFSDDTSTTTLGYDSSGNDNHWTLNNFATTNQSTDTPTNNSCTLNSINMHSESTPFNGNLRVNGTNDWHKAIAGTFAPTSGKWYFEVKQVGIGTYDSIGVANENFRMGIHHVYPTASDQKNITWMRAVSNGFSMISVEGTTTNPWGDDTAITTDEIRQVAFDVDTGKVWFGLDGTWEESGNPASGTSPAGTFASAPEYLIPVFNAYAADTMLCQFNEDELTYTPPTGFNPLMTKYLPEPTIKDPENYISSTLYTGNATASRVISTPNKVDMLWLKNRDQNDKMRVHNSVSGVTYYLEMDQTRIKTDANGVTALSGTSGFTVGTGANGVNDNAEDFTAIAFTENVSAGIDLVSYTGNGSNRTISHSLGVAPDIVVIFAWDTTDTYGTRQDTYVRSVGATEYLLLGDNVDSQTSSSRWQDTDPTSSVFSLGTSAEVNRNTVPYIALVLASIEGFSKVFEYVGDDLLGGVFVHTGFKPSFLLVKKVGSRHWIIFTNDVNTYNPIVKSIETSSADAEKTFTEGLDFVSNGFKLRSTDDDINQGGTTYIGIAFAEYPFALLNNASL